jgi:hypothetical protein
MSKPLSDTEIAGTYEYLAIQEELKENAILRPEVVRRMLDEIGRLRAELNDATWLVLQGGQLALQGKELADEGKTMADATRAENERLREKRAREDKLIAVVMEWIKSRNALSADCHRLGIGSGSEDSPKWQAELLRREKPLREAAEEFARG